MGQTHGPRGAVDDEGDGLRNHVRDGAKRKKDGGENRRPNYELSYGSHVSGSLNCQSSHYVTLSQKNGKK